MYQTELTNIEIRQIILDVLAYDGNDLDGGGTNFPKYDYQGSQSDLYRLINGYIIKHQIKPALIPVRSTAWGGDGVILTETTINLSRNEILKLFQEFHYLILQGILSPGGYEYYGDNLPYFHVTEYGKRCLLERDFLPYNSESYLKEVRNIENMNNWVEFYLSEALATFNANCINSSIINIGLAGETIANEVIDSFGIYLQNKSSSLHAEYLNKIAQRTTISNKYETYVEYFKKEIKNTVDSQLKTLKIQYGSTFSTYAAYNRLTRNSLSHPSELVMDRTSALLHFASFLNYCKVQYQFINHYKM